MSESRSHCFEALSHYLASRRAAILCAWRNAARADPEQTTAHALTRGQFNDHIPELLNAFERRLRARPGGADSAAAESATIREEVKHGLHRWQQGYRLQELTNELGHLQLCLFEELEIFAAAHPEFERQTLAEANRQMIILVNEAISESAGQYARLQQAEAAGHVGDLEQALAAVSQIERQRAALIHQAVHDLRGNVQSVTSAADGLGADDIAEAERVAFAALLQQGVQSVIDMLGELMELARLEAGQERREIVTFDAGVLATELGNRHRPIATQKGLFLKTDGPPHLSIDGDPGKVTRLLQNLLLNALKYTLRGGVVLNWGEEKGNWWVMVKDTGPGILAGPGAPMIIGLKEATASARESDEKTAAREGETSKVLTSRPGAPMSARGHHQQAGEGIGLSVVKRLCELLDASLEVASSAESGTAFRVVLPREYAEAPAKPAQRSPGLR